MHLLADHDLPHLEAAKFDAALASHRDALIAEWKRDHDNGDRASDQRPPLPNTGAAFMRLVEAGWDAEVGCPAARAAHHRGGACGRRGQRAAALHLGPLLSEADRRYLSCDATCEVWFERDGQVDRRGAGDAADQPPAAPCAGVPPSHVCGARVVGPPGVCTPTTSVHWEDGGPTELDNLVLLCPYHHRLHHRGVITITGPADDLCVTDSAGRRLSSGSLARPPTRPPPAVPPCPGPTGERADWKWYQPFQPQPPPTN